MSRKIQYLLFILLVVTASCSYEKDFGSSETGTGGSMARFTITGNYLYTVDFNNLHSFDISQPSSIQYLGMQHAGFGIETIFPIDDRLYLGARDGMHVYSLENPGAPEHLAYISHFRSYDPVVVQGNYAYVTLRSGGNSWGGRNELQIFDVTHLNNISAVKIYPMSNPRGLAIDGDLLFVCDNVLKVYKVTDGTQLSLITSFEVKAIDVIAKGNFLQVVAEDGFYQYTYQDNQIELISKITIPFTKK